MAREYSINVRVNDNIIERHPIDDVFFTTVVTMSWRDLLKSLFKGKAVVIISVNGNDEAYKHFFAEPTSMVTNKENSNG